MGFKNPEPALFDAYAGARLARLHMEGFLSALEQPLLERLQDTVGPRLTASRYWPNGGRFSYARDGRIDIPFRVPAEGEWRVRAGVAGWEPPTSAFHVQPAPSQRWNAKVASMSERARGAVEFLVAHEFDREWMRVCLPLTQELVRAPDFEERVVDWAHGQFRIVRESGILEVGLFELSGGDLQQSPDDR
jgi:hypothetical protein